MPRSYRRRSVAAARRSEVEATYDEAVASYRRYQQSRNFSQDTLKVTEDCLVLLRAFFGGDVPVTQITTDSCRAFQLSTWQ
jgi:hypothetical protein